jgi:hypothetical protein
MGLCRWQTKAYQHHHQHIPRGARGDHTGRYRQGQGDDSHGECVCLPRGGGGVHQGEGGRQGTGQSLTRDWALGAWLGASSVHVLVCAQLKVVGGGVRAGACSTFKWGARGDGIGRDCHWEGSNSHSLGVCLGDTQKGRGLRAVSRCRLPCGCSGLGRAGFILGLCAMEGVVGGGGQGRGV